MYSVSRFIDGLPKEFRDWSAEKQIDFLATTETRRSLRLLILDIIDESGTSRGDAPKFSIREMASLARYLVLQECALEGQNHG